MVERSKGMLEERIEEVTRLNEAFYQAFENLDVAAMDRVWGPPRIRYMHPSRLEYQDRVAGGSKIHGW